jgi:hypothetical protein
MDGKEEVVDFVPEFSQRNYDYRNYETGAIAKAISKLGNEGWEMVSKETDVEKQFKPFYFKRLQQ